MKNLLDKIFSRSNNLDYISQSVKELTKQKFTNKVFEAISSYSPDSEIRYVGGCIRKIINKEKVDDIDLATNLEPKEVCMALEKNNIKFYESGIEHGTITAIISDYKFEITSLRKDIRTDGRHAKVEFSKDWKADASRRDFTINAIYSDKDGNLFDPFNGKKDLESGLVNFIGRPDERIREDYLRIVRYLRFFLNYSKQSHDPEIIRTLKINIEGITKLSKERLLNELKKLINFKSLEKLSKDKISLNLIMMIFPELKNINILFKLNDFKKRFVIEKDFIFLIALMIIDGSDNTDYFLFKFNISKKHQKRIKMIDDFFKEKLHTKSFTKNDMNKIFYYNGKQSVLDILNFKILKSKKIDKQLVELHKHYLNSQVPEMPISANFIMEKYKITEGKYLGEKLKNIEELWINNNFKISQPQIDKIFNV